MLKRKVVPTELSKFNVAWYKKRDAVCGPAPPTPGPAEPAPQTPGPEPEPGPEDPEPEPATVELSSSSSALRVVGADIVTVPALKSVQAL